MSSRLSVRAFVTALNAFVVAVLVFAYAVSFAAVIFSGALAANVGIAIGSALIAVAIGGAITALRSAFTFAIGGPDSNPTAVLALVAAAVSTQVAKGDSAATVMMIVTLATACTGTLFFVLGRVGAGRLIRYIPQPMIGGFNAASGVLVAIGAIRVLAAHSPLLAHVGVGVAFGVLIIVLSRRFGSSAIPAALIGALFLVLAGAWIGHIPLANLRESGWLFSFPHSSPWLPWTSSGTVDWHVVVTQIPNMLVVAIVATATLLLNSSGLELLTAHDVDLDRELRVAGIANLVSACFGAMVSFVSFSRSSMNYGLGTRSRGVGAAVAVAAAVLVVLGPDRIITFVPVFATAGLLIAIGWNLVYDWLIRAPARHSIGDTITIWLIVATVVTAGFVAGIFVGLAAGCITFVIRYSQIDAVKRRASAATIHSRLLRSRREAGMLLEHGARIRIFELRGYIFFGIADRIYRELLACAQTMESPGWIILDFTAVTGMDSSAADACAKLLRNLHPDADIRVAVAGMRARVARMWNAAMTDDLRPFAFDDLDLAMEWCETELLRFVDSGADTAQTIELWLTEQVGNEIAPLLLRHMKRVELDTGDVLCLAGEPSDRMYIIERGRVAVITADEDPRRLMSVGAHATIGELGLYRHMLRSATVVAEVPTIAYELSRDDLDAIEAHDPAASTAFHGAVIRGLGDRMEYQNGLLTALLES